MTTDNTIDVKRTIRRKLDTQVYNSSEAYALLVTEVIFIAILLVMLIYWHYLHPDSIEVTR
jgi:hypothetical protein